MPLNECKIDNKPVANNHRRRNCTAMVARYGATSIRLCEHDNDENVIHRTRSTVQYDNLQNIN